MVRQYGLILCLLVAELAEDLLPVDPEVGERLLSGMLIVTYDS